MHIAASVTSNNVKIIENNSLEQAETPDPLGCGCFSRPDYNIQ
jgi:hypothetical protein